MVRFRPNLDGYYDVSNQFIAWVHDRAKRQFAEQAERKARITSVAQFEEHRTRMRANFLDAIGGLPAERTPLHAGVSGTIECDGYTMEKVMYQSVPEFYVTAALYLPHERERPAPAVLFVHGHAENGKSSGNYQQVCIDLAKNGFVVFAMDPPGQGERYQYWEPATSERVIGGCTTEHTYAGMQYVVRGASIARHFVWDAMRGIDYLETRPEVDPKRIAVTGSSGGGTQSSFLMVAEPRLAAAVPCTFVMTLESYLYTGQAQDSEQIVAGGIMHGPDHDDYVTCMAPKPVLIGAAAYDFFPIEGAMEAVERARRSYRLFGAEENVAIEVAPTRHSYSRYLREACVNFLRKHLQHRPGDFRSDNPQPLPGEALNVTPNGQVLDLHPHSKTLHDLGREQLDAMRPTPPRDPAGLGRVVAEALHVSLDGRRAGIHARIINESVVDGYPVEKIFFFSEPAITVAGVLVHPRQVGPAAQTDVLVLEEGTEDVENERPRIEALLRRNHRVFIFDPRGVGAVIGRPFARGGSPHSTEYRLGCDAYMAGVSTLGGRVFDVLRAFDYLATRDDVDAGKIGLHGVGSGAIYAYLAAAMEPRFCALTFESMLYSYRHFAMTRYYDSRRCTLRIMAYGLLRRFDLPDLLAAMAPRPTRIVRARDCNHEPLSPEQFTELVLEPQRAAGRLPAGWAPEIA